MSSECCNELAISSIQVQKFSPEKLYEPKTALENGTIFSELNKPFFAANELETTTCCDCNCTEEEKALYEIMCVSFTLDDLTLFLDTHPTDADALSLLNENLNKRMNLLDDFAKKYYPLTKATIPQSENSTEHFNYLNGPIPWEGVCL